MKENHHYVKTEKGWILVKGKVIASVLDREKYEERYSFYVLYLTDSEKFVLVDTYTDELAENEEDEEETFVNVYKNVDEFLDEFVQPLEKWEKRLLREAAAELDARDAEKIRKKLEEVPEPIRVID